MSDDESTNLSANKDPIKLSTPSPTKRNVNNTVNETKKKLPATTNSYGTKIKNVIRKNNETNAEIVSIKRSRLEILKHVILQNRKTIRELEQKKIETVVEYSRVRNEFTAIKNKYEIKYDLLQRNKNNNNKSKK